MLGTHDLRQSRTITGITRMIARSAAVSITVHNPDERMLRHRLCPYVP